MKTKEKTAAVPPEDGFHKEMWVYVGRAVGNSNKLIDGYQFILSAAFNETVDQLSGVKYFAADRKRKVVGGVYEVMVKRVADTITAKLTGARYERDWRNKADVARWSIADDATGLLMASKSAERKSKNRHLELLAPLSEDYQKLISTDERLAFELAVLHYLRRRT